jgi:hypothetical protein
MPLRAQGWIALASAAVVFALALSRPGGLEWILEGWLLFCGLALCGVTAWWFFRNRP